MDIKDQYGNPVGRLENDGTMKDIYGNRIGRIDNYRK